MKNIEIKKMEHGNSKIPPLKNSTENTDYQLPEKPSHKRRIGKIIMLVLIISIPLSLALGAVGGLVADRFIWPYLQQYDFFSKNNFFKSIDIIDGGKTTIVRKEQVVTVEENSAIIDSAGKVSPSVVSIITTEDVVNFFGNVSEQRGGGTGFIITSDGLILTNRHVIEGVSNLKVLTSDGKSYDASILSLDPANDLGVLKINAENLPVVSFGDSDEIRVGQRVIAIGNALGQYQNTVTAGVISARDRTITVSEGNGINASIERLEGVIQTDAAINPGNSGGPLVNILGEVLGINTAIDAGGQTIGFAIPINIAKPAISSVIESGEIIRPFLGVRFVQITNEIAELNQLSVQRGALITGGGNQIEFAVMPGSPADKAGLKENDIITKLNNDEINEGKGLSTLIQKYQPGDTIEITYLRAGEEQKTKATLDKMK